MTGIARNDSAAELRRNGRTVGRVAFRFAVVAAVVVIVAALALGIACDSFAPPMQALPAWLANSLSAGWHPGPGVRFALIVVLAAGAGFAGGWIVRGRRRQVVRAGNDERTSLERASEVEHRTALLEDTLSAASVGGWQLDVATGQFRWTAEMYRIHEIAPEDYTPALDTTLDFFGPEARATLRDAVESSIHRGRSWDLELELITATGRKLWTHATGTAKCAANGRATSVSGSLQDISERRASEERIRRMAHHDELTGLANRALFGIQLNRGLVRAERYDRKLAVLFVDLDRFKHINDTYGHGVGDDVLIALGQRLVDSVRAADLVARLGGDEFVILIEELDAPEAMAELARKLLRVIEQPVVACPHELLLSASIGIATYPADGLDAQALLKHADIAMYRAKEQGRDTFEFFSPHLESATDDVLSLEACLRRAVMELRQFVLHYQPRISTTNGRMTGVEALVRWSTPEALVLPEEFIGLAEETGLIGTLGSWVLGSACAQASG